MTTTHPNPTGDAPTHLPPQNLEAEEAILGAMLMSQFAIDRAVDAGLKATDFYRPSHRTIFAAIMKLAERGGIDELMVCNELQASGNLTEAGGKAAVFSLSERVPAIANAKAYAEEVVAQGTLRGLVEVGHEIARLGYEHPDEPARLISQAGVLIDALSERRTLGTAGFTTLADALQDLYAHLSDRAEQGTVMSGIPTGLNLLDSRWGGLNKGDFILIAARPGMGKSGLMGTIAENVVLGSGIDVAVINLEMPVRQQVARSLSRFSGIALNRMTKENPADSDWPVMVEAIERTEDFAKRMHFDESSDLTITQIRQRMRGLARRIKRDGRRLGAIFIDYVQLADADQGTGRGQSENRTQEISKISRGLKSMALELDVPVVALSQLSRQVESRPDKRPQLSDLRESGSLEQDADIVTFLLRPEYYSKDETPIEFQGVCQVITAKNRSGEPGDDLLRFEGKYTRFSNRTFEAGSRPAA